MSVNLANISLSGDYQLLLRFVQADNKAICKIYEDYFPSVANHIIKNGGNEEDARDIFQEALMVLYKKAKSGDFELTSSLKTFIISICKYQWLNNVRKNSRISRIDDSIEMVDLDSNYIEQLERAEKFRLLQQHLSKLNATNQKILTLYFQNYSTKEIAQELGLTKLYVKKMKYLAKKKLMESIRLDGRFKDFLRA